jgi:hypothetical protein
MPTTRVVGYPSKGAISSGTASALRMTYGVGGIDLPIANKFTTLDYILNWTLGNNDQREGPAWAANTALAVGDIRVNTSTTATKYWIVDAVTGDATTGASQPAWDMLAFNTTVDNNVTWRAITTTWAASKTISLGTIVLPTVANGFFYVCTARTGDFKTGASQPSPWGTTPGGTTSDNHVTWTCYSALAQITAKSIPATANLQVYFETNQTYNTADAAYWKTNHRYTPYRHSGANGGIIGAATTACYSTLVNVAAGVVVADTVWAANTAYTVGQRCKPVMSTSFTGLSYVCTVAGTSHASTEPIWPTVLGQTISDGTCTWIAVEYQNNGDIIEWWASYVSGGGGYAEAGTSFGTANGGLFSWLGMLPDQQNHIEISASSRMSEDTSFAQSVPATWENLALLPYGAGPFISVANGHSLYLNRIQALGNSADSGTFSITGSGILKAYNSIFNDLFNFRPQSANSGSPDWAYNNCAFVSTIANGPPGAVNLIGVWMRGRNLLYLLTDTDSALISNPADYDFVVATGHAALNARSLVQAYKQFSKIAAKTAADLKFAIDLKGGRQSYHQADCRFVRGAGSILEAVGCPLIHIAGFSDIDIDGKARPDVTPSTSQAISAGDRTQTNVRVTCNNHGLVTNDKAFISGMASMLPAVKLGIVRSTDSIIRYTAHGFSDGDVVLAHTAPWAGNNWQTTLYYAIATAANTLQLSATSGGGALSCTTSQVIEFMAGLFLDATANTFAGRGTGLANGMVVRSMTTAQGLTLNTDYFVRDFSEPTFKVETAPGAGAIDLTGSKTAWEWRHGPSKTGNWPGLFRTFGGWTYLDRKIFTVTRIDDNIIELNGIASTNMVSDYATEAPGGYIQKYTGALPSIGPSEGISLPSYISGTTCFAGV